MKILKFLFRYKNPVATFVNLNQKLKIPEISVSLIHENELDRTGFEKPKTTKINHSTKSFNQIFNN